MAGAFSGLIAGTELDDRRLSLWYDALGGVGLLVWPLDFKANKME
jgi:hypothetical protein